MFNKKLILGLFVFVLIASVVAGFETQDSSWSIVRHFPVPDTWYNYNIENFNFTISTSNTLTNCDYSINGAPKVDISCAGVSSYFDDIAIAPLSDGNHNIRLCAEDDSFSLTCDNELFYVDTTPPTITDDFVNDGIWVNVDQIVTLDPQDGSGSGISEVRYCEGIGCAPNLVLISPYQLNYNTDQDTIVRYQAWDNVGSPSIIGEFNVKIDKTTPIVDAGIDVITNVQVLQDATVDGSVSGVASYLWSGAPEINFGTSDAEDTTIDSIADGDYVIRLTVVDNAGNNASDEINFIWDTTAPITTDDAPIGWQSADATVTLTPIDGLSGVADTLYCVDQIDACLPGTSGTSILVSDEGVNYVRYYSSDVAGNDELVNSVSVSVDKSVPTITDDFVNDGIWVNVDQIVTLDPQDVVSGIKEVKYCEGVACVPAFVLNSPYELNYILDQDTIIRYQAFDNADNPSLIGEYNVLLDKSEPTTSDDYTSDGFWVNIDQTINLTENCDISGCAWTRYCTDAIDCDPSTGIDYVIPVVINTEGITYFRYASQDKAGNIQTTVSREIKIDKIAPVTTASAISETVYTSPVEVTLTCVDGGSGCDITSYCYATTNDCIPISTYSNKITISENGVWFVRFRSIDTVGNLENIQDASNNATINIPPPSGSPSSGGGSYTPSAPIIVQNTTIVEEEEEFSAESGEVVEPEVSGITGAVVGGGDSNAVKDILSTIAILAAAGLCIFLYRRWWIVQNKLPGSKK